MPGFRVRSILVLLTLTAAVCAVPARAEMVSRIAAVVNGDIITTYQLEQAVQTQLAKSERQPSAAQLGALRQELLSRLIEEQLVQQRIRALKLQVSDEEVENAILDVQKQNRLSRAELEQAVQVQGQTMSVYRDNLRKQILRYKLVGQEVRSKVDVSEREVRDYYRAHLDEYRLPPAVTLSAVTFPIPEKAGAAERERIRAAATGALEQLRQGTALEQVAAAYRDQFGATSGVLGTFTAGEMNAEFDRAVQGVDAGGFGVPAETEAAIVLLRVDQRTSGGLRQFETMRPEITQTLVDQKTDGRIKEWTRGLKQKAFIDIRL